MAKPKLAVWKLASCDGCQLTLLDCEDELLALAGAVEIAHFTEASSAEVEGPYDVSLVEGSVTTERDARRIVEIRAASRFLVSIGACATAGGIQALRNFADVREFTSVVYARPDYIATLATSTAPATASSSSSQSSKVSWQPSQEASFHTASFGRLRGVREDGSPGEDTAVITAP